MYEFKIFIDNVQYILIISFHIINDNKSTIQEKATKKI